MNKSIILLFVVIVLSLIIAPELFSQPPFPAMNPTQAPIDGGLTAVAVGAGAWAVNKLRKQKK